MSNIEKAYSTPSGYLLIIPNISRYAHVRVVSIRFLEKIGSSLFLPFDWVSGGLRTAIETNISLPDPIEQNNPQSDPRKGPQEGSDDLPVV